MTQELQNKTEDSFSISAMFYKLFCSCCLSNRTISLPNFEKIKIIYGRIKSAILYQECDDSLLDRESNYDLCQWSQKLLKILPDLGDNPKIKIQTQDLVEHFNSIKRFYKALEKGHIDNYPSFNQLFSGVQTYECVLSLAFVVFQEKPEVLREIDKELSKAESLIQELDKSCYSILLSVSNNSVYKKLDLILETIDSRIGELSLVRVSDFIVDTIEVFCPYSYIDLNQDDKITRAFELIEKTNRKISSKLKEILPEYSDLNQRKQKWGLLEITQNIQSKSDEFEVRAPVVRKLIASFDRYYNSMTRLSESFDMISKKNLKPIEAPKPLAEKRKTQRYSVLNSIVNKIRLSTVDKNKALHNLAEKYPKPAPPGTNPLLAEVETVGGLFQKLETVLCYLVLFFKDEEDILYPLSGHVDECTRIIEKHCNLNIVYKITYGANFLNKIKVVLRRIFALFELSKLNINSPRDIIVEFKRRYSDLIFILFDSSLNQKNNTETIDQIINEVLDSVLEKLRIKNDFNSESELI